MPMLPPMVTSGTPLSCSGGHLGEHEVGHLLRPIARVAERHQGGEFVATEPGQLHIPRTDLLEPTGNPLQQPITGLVAVVVVDQLEVVQVHEHQRKTPTQPAIGLQRFHQAIAIEQAGQRVVPGQVTVFQLFQFAVGDVTHGEQDLGPC